MVLVAERELGVFVCLLTHGLCGKTKWTQPFMEC